MGTHVFGWGFSKCPLRSDGMVGIRCQCTRIIMALISILLLFHRLTPCVLVFVQKKRKPENKIHMELDSNIEIEYNSLFFCFTLSRFIRRSSRVWIYDTRPAFDTCTTQSAMQSRKHTNDAQKHEFYRSFQMILHLPKRSSIGRT